MRESSHRAGNNRTSGQLLDNKRNKCGVHTHSPESEVDGICTKVLNVPWRAVRLEQGMVDPVGDLVSVLATRLRWVHAVQVAKF